MPYLLWLRHKDKLGDFDFKADIPDMTDPRQQPTLDMFKKGYVGGQVTGFINKDCNVIHKMLSRRLNQQSRVF